MHNKMKTYSKIANTQQTSGLDDYVPIQRLIATERKQRAQNQLKQTQHEPEWHMRVNVEPRDDVAKYANQVRIDDKCESFI